VWFQSRAGKDYPADRVKQNAKAKKFPGKNCREIKKVFLAGDRGHSIKRRREKTAYQR